MTFRTRLLLAFAAATLLPLVLLGVGVRRQIETRLTGQHARRVDALVRVALEDLTRERASINSRLHSLASSLGEDNRLRLAMLGGAAADESAAAKSCRVSPTARVRASSGAVHDSAPLIPASAMTRSASCRATASSER